MGLVEMISDMECYLHVTQKYRSVRDPNKHVDIYN